MVQCHHEAEKFLQQGSRRIFLDIRGSRGLQSRYAHSQDCCKNSVPSSFKSPTPVIAGHANIQLDSTLERIKNPR